MNKEQDGTGETHRPALGDADYLPNLGKFLLSIIPPGVPALLAPQEFGFWLISCSRLYKPVKGLAVLAFGAFCFCQGKGFHFFSIDDLYFLLRLLNHFLELRLLHILALVSAGAS